ncbi:hypothetical protein ABZ348_02775 [Streptomyces sp. NPDC005963]|uniref:hypothetical protein n=1 Tax=Streptomyces sp. NPDC005963 TaxID=3156721 RepID=UPI0033C88FF7
MAAPIYLIVRSADFVVLAVEWSGFELRTDGHPPVPRLVATGEAPIVTLTFPPQAILEQTTASEFHTAGFVYSDSRLSQPSRLVFRVRAGAVIELSAQGILNALTRQGQARVDGPSSLLELPWGIDALPLAKNVGALVRSDHLPHPAASTRTGAVSLWAARLRASDGGPADALLAYQPTGSREGSGLLEGGLFQAPPLHGWRASFVAWSAQYSLPSVTRLELTSLGGAVSLLAKWPTSSWTHDVALGRDNIADGTAQGRLWPFGFPCVYRDFTRREFLPVYGSAAVGCVAALRKQRILVISRPLLSGTRTRTFPFDEVEILGDAFDLSGTPTPNPAINFLPGGASSPMRFPIRCRTGDTTVQFDIPLVFVADTELGPKQSVLDEWMPYAKVKIPGVAIDLIGAGGRPGDIQEVHSLTFTGSTQGPEYRSDLTGFDVVLASLRTLLPGGDHEQPRPMKYAAGLREGSTRASIPPVPMVFVPPDVPVSFTGRPDRSGALVAPKFTADGISRELGPVATCALREEATSSASSGTDAFAGATLFGFPLSSLIDTTGGHKPSPPQIVQRRVGTEITTEMRWKALRLKAHNTFQPRTTGQPPQLDLFVSSRSQPAKTTREAAEPPPPTCALKNFALVLPPPPAAKLLTLSFESATFNQRPGLPADLALNTPEIEFHGPLKLLQKLQRMLEPLLSDGLTSRVSTNGITVGYEITLPKAAAGAFILQHVAARLAVTIPYEEKPVTVVLGFASREHPFALSVTGFTGGGYATVEIAGAGDPKVEICMEFGAMLAVDFVVARAEVHALGGVRFLRRSDGSLELEAFVRIGGSVRLLGLVTVSIELRVSLLFRDGPPRLLGRATLVIELDLTLYSGSVTIDSGTFELVGGRDERAPEVPAMARNRSAAAFTAWEQYRRAFAL